MKRSHQILLWILMGVTIILSFIILMILLFKQEAVPHFSAEKGDKGENATVEQITEAVTQYLASNPPANGKDAPPISQEDIATAVAQYLQSNPPAPGKDGQSIAGANGSSCTTTSVEGGATILCTDGTSSFIANGTNGADGRTPILRCNTNRNRWEIRYSEDESWVVVKDQAGNSVRCTTGKPDNSVIE